MSEENKNSSTEQSTGSGIGRRGFLARCFLAAGVAPIRGKPAQPT